MVSKLRHASISITSNKNIGIKFSVDETFLHQLCSKSNDCEAIKFDVFLSHKIFNSQGPISPNCTSHTSAQEFLDQFFKKTSCDKFIAWHKNYMFGFLHITKKQIKSNKTLY